MHRKKITRFLSLVLCAGMLLGDSSFVSLANSLPATQMETVSQDTENSGSNEEEEIEVKTDEDDTEVDLKTESEEESKSTEVEVKTSNVKNEQQNNSTDALVEPETESAEEEGADAALEPEQAEDDEPETETKEVTADDLSALINAVNEESGDFSPAYEFTEGKKKAYVDGLKVKMDEACKQEEDTYVVPAEVFEGDAMIASEELDQDTVSLNAIADASEYTVVTDGNTVTLSSPYDSKCIIVKDAELSDTYGAVTDIHAYDGMDILYYDTVADTKAAYEAFAAEGISAELDVYSQTEELKNIFEPETEKIGIEEFLNGSKKSSDGNGSATEALADALFNGDDSNVTENSGSYRDVTVAVLDTGYDYDHSKPDRIMNGVDVSGAGSAQDENGHGTAMANIIMDATGDSISLLPVRITDDKGRSSSLKMYLGMEAALANGADILNVSMSAYKPADGSMIADEIAKLKEQGIFVVTAAGNYGGDTADYVPANVEAAITVAAINTNDEADGYSNHGSTVDYSAYGSVTATVLDGKEENVSGTSVSAAIVSAIVADRLSKNEDTGYDAVINYLNEQAKDLGTEGRDDIFGVGALYLDSITGNEEEEWEGLDAPILTCDWKNISDEELDKILTETDNILIRFP